MRRGSRQLAACRSHRTRCRTVRFRSSITKASVRHSDQRSESPPPRSDGFRAVQRDDPMAAPHTPARFLLGEAGIGKSTAMRGSAEKHAGPVFRVACQRIALEIPFDPLFALLQSVTRQTLPGAAVSRASVRDAVLELQFALERSTMNAAPLVQIDDLHWADEASLNAVPYWSSVSKIFPCGGSSLRAPATIPFGRSTTVCAKAASRRMQPCVRSPNTLSKRSSPRRATISIASNAPLSSRNPAVIHCTRNS